MELNLYNCVLNHQRAGTELIRFNIVNSMVADALAPCVARTWYWLCRIGELLSWLRKDFNYLGHANVEEWHKCKYMFLFLLKNSARKGSNQCNISMSQCPHFIGWLVKLPLKPTHWGSDNICGMLQATFYMAFMQRHVWYFDSNFSEFCADLFCTEPATSHFLNQWWHSLTTHMHDHELHGLDELMIRRIVTSHRKLTVHCVDVLMSDIESRLKRPASRLLTQSFGEAQIKKKYIKAPRHRPLW